VRGFVNESIAAAGTDATNAITRKSASVGDLIISAGESYFMRKVFESDLRKLI
jgi:hypothetical protein